MDRFKAMQVFTRVVEAGSFTRAAETLEMPRATVTTAIQQLEAHLGVRLLNRTTRRVAVTVDGGAYYERCLHLLEALADTEAMLTTLFLTQCGTPCLKWLFFSTAGGEMGLVGGASMSAADA